MIEAELDPTGRPVLGLYLHVAYMRVIATFASGVGQGEITPNLIGVLALVHRQPGMNQAELARLIGVERATLGEQVSRAVTQGFVRRERSPRDSRSYALHLTPRGATMLRNLRKRIPSHEQEVGRNLSLEERKQLRALLDKLAYG
jgi:DNA-binding MarR family transcriptional regulator